MCSRALRACLQGDSREFGQTYGSNSQACSQEKTWLCGVMLVHVLGSSVQISGKSLLACSVQRLLLAGRPLAGKMTRLGPIHPANHSCCSVCAWSMYGLWYSAHMIMVTTMFSQEWLNEPVLSRACEAYAQVSSFCMVSLSASPQPSHERARQKGDQYLFIVMSANSLAAICHDGWYQLVPGTAYANLHRTHSTDGIKNSCFLLNAFRSEEVHLQQNS